MSIYYRTVVIAGLPYKDFPKEDELEDLIYSDDIYRAAPYCDAQNEDCLFGILIRETGSYSGLDMDQALAQDALREFKRLTGLDGRIYLALDVS